MRFTKTDAWITIYGLSLTICSLIFIFQILGLFYNSSRLSAENRQSYTSKKKSVWKVLIPLFTTYILSIAGISSAIHRLHDAQQSLCDYTYSLTFAFYASIKIANYFFFLQRAKLAQGINPIFKDKIFDKYLPILLIILWIIYMLAISLYPLPGQRVISPSGRKLCIWAKPNTLQYSAVLIQTVMDIIISSFFLYLFGKPMLEIQRKTQNITKKGSSREKDHADKKLNRTILINFVFSTICSLHTGFSAITFPFGSIFSWWPILDFAVSSICLFLMLASNRRFLVHLLCCNRKFAEKCIKPPTFLNKKEQEAASQNAELQKQEVANHTLSVINISPNHLPNPAPNAIILNVDDKERNITFCRYLCIGGKQKHSDSITVNQWMEYLDGNCCYYKSKLLWTWLYYNFCFCHCYIMTLYLIPKNRGNNHRIKKRQKTMNRLFISADQLMTKKFYAGVDMEPPSHSPNPSAIPSTMHSSINPSINTSTNTKKRTIIKVIEPINCKNDDNGNHNNDDDDGSIDGSMITPQTTPIATENHLNFNHLIIHNKAIDNKTNEKSTKL